MDLPLQATGNPLPTVRISVSCRHTVWRGKEGEAFLFCPSSLGALEVLALRWVLIEATRNSVLMGTHYEEQDDVPGD